MILACSPCSTVAVTPPGLLLSLPLFIAVLSLTGLRRRLPFFPFVATLASGTAFLVALVFLMMGGDGPEAVTCSWSWMDLPGLSVPLEWVADSLARMMLVVVTGVGFLVHVFSWGYMAEEKDKGRYFGGLAFFLFSMTGVVLAGNLLLMFLFWELVGVSSYLLIGFWFDRPAAGAAAKKAFIVNRIGDFGFFLGILFFWTLTGTLSFAAVDGRAQIIAALLEQPPFYVTITALLLFCGCIGKSAQIPLHVWLPDAMEGPTPVSALIHAATMVAAGVYLLCRLYFMLSLSAEALTVIAYVGGFTAFLAALMATQQSDIKRILAYSTLSQLGLMVLAVGCSAPGAAMFHLTTHACFKALLFLAAGSVIVGLHHEQNIWKMGGLARRMPVTFWTMLIGTLALAGCPGFSGFFSKDAILAAVFAQDRALGFLAAVSAFLTAFYMFRLVAVVFLGEPRGEHAMHAHESRRVMTAPLMVLALFSVVAGYPMLGLEHAYGAFFHGLEIIPAAAHHQAVLGLSLVVFVAGALIALARYQNKKQEPVPIPVLANRFYIDEFYRAAFIGPAQVFARAVARLDERLLGGWVVRGSGAMLNGAGEFLRVFQTGSVSTYALWLSVGMGLLLWWVLSRAA